MLFQILANPVRHIKRGARIDEIRRADRYRRSPRDEKLYRVLSRHDAPHADDWNLDRVVDLPYHTQRDRLNRGPRQTAGQVGELGTTSLGINRHTEQRVNHGKPVRAGVFDSAGNLGDVRDIRR